MSNSDTQITEPPDRPPHKKTKRPIRKMVIVVLLVCTIVGGGWIANTIRLEHNRQQTADEREKKRQQRLANAENINNVDLHNNEHPLDQVLLLAQASLKHINENILDYTADLYRQERVADVLLPPNSLAVKIRNARGDQPLSIYVLFQGSDAARGREVIWVAGKDDNKITAHEGGILNLFRVNQPHDGFVAMMGSRYSIAETGIQRMMETLIQYGISDRNQDECEVQVTEVKSAGVNCRRIRIVHPVAREHFSFHIAELDLDLKRNIPVRIATWTWPEQDGGEPLLVEEYIYRNIKLNVGLTEIDFDPDNENYNYPD